MRVVHKYTPEQIEFITKNVPGRSNAELKDMVNAHFGLNLSVIQINTFKKNRGLKSGLDCRFTKGQKAWNEGLKGLDMGGKATQFKKGNRPFNYRPVGSERVNVDGYTEVKVADPGKWKLKHIWIWEQAYGPIPKGSCLIFLDGNNLNVTLENLQVITRQQLVRINQNHLISDNPEVTKTGLIIADILCKIGERKKLRSSRS